jgi:exodeoxyribonuclease VII large subunit
MELFNHPSREEISLLELSRRIKQSISRSFTSTYWVRAEMSDVRHNASGHCYLEFVEKNPSTGQVIAKVRASIWARTFFSLKPRFEAETGQAFASGLKVLARVAVDYHELYGLSLNVTDVDPSYTVGDMLMKRLEIIARLKKEGVYTLNKELPLPALVRRIAVITSATAAGYEDFVNHITGNGRGFLFYHRLFPAVMQGERAEQSVITALEEVFLHMELFDAVVIIRGGGASSELNCFDSYLLASNCAQFPLPVISGIGHERDDTVLDMVAHTRMKTPTAVADFLIGRMESAYACITSLQQAVVRAAGSRMTAEGIRFQKLLTRLPQGVSARLEVSRSQLNGLALRLPSASINMVGRRRDALNALEAALRRRTADHIAKAAHFLDITSQFIRLASPEYILRRGYSITMRGDRIIKRSTAITPGDAITIHFIDGKVNATTTPPSADTPPDNNR